MHHLHAHESFATSGIHQRPHVFHREGFPIARGTAAEKNELTHTLILGLQGVH
jgi:hypothetical protein